MFSLPDMAKLMLPLEAQSLVNVNSDLRVCHILEEYEEEENQRENDLRHYLILKLGALEMLSKKKWFSFPTLSFYLATKISFPSYFFKYFTFVIYTSFHVAYLLWYFFLA